MTTARSNMHQCQGGVSSKARAGTPIRNSTGQEHRVLIALHRPRSIDAGRRAFGREGWQRLLGTNEAVKGLQGVGQMQPVAEKLLGERIDNDSQAYAYW